MNNKYSIIYKNSPVTNGIFYRVHKYGCSDVRMEQKRFAGTVIEVEASNVQEAVAKHAAVVKEAGYGKRNFQLAACVK